MAEMTRVTLGDLEVVSDMSVAPHKEPPSVIVGLWHIAGRAARLGVPNPKKKVAKFLLSPQQAEQLGRELLKAAEAALSPSTH